MSKPIHIESEAQFQSLLNSSKIVVADFWADWCGPCKAIAPIYEQLSAQLSRPNKVTFTKIDVDAHNALSAKYDISAMPTFLVFNNGKQVDKVLGADPKKLSTAVKKIAAEADGNGGDGGYNWIGTALPKGYSDITDQVDVRNLDLLNADTTLGDARGLLANTKPSSLGGKVKEGEKKDWVESDTDEQLMLFMPFQSSLKLHTIHVTSLPPSGEEDAPMRPKSISIYSNRAHVLGFDEAEGIPATQSITLTERDWDAETGTAKIELRFVKFQNVTSLVIFVIDGEGDGEKVRIDRLRLIGETGEKREMGKLEKVGEGND